MRKQISGAIVFFLLLAVICVLASLPIKPVSAATTEKIFYGCSLDTPYDWKMHRIDTDGTSNITIAETFDYDWGYFDAAAVDIIQQTVYFVEINGDNATNQFVYKCDINGGGLAVWKDLPDISTSTRALCANDNTVFYSLAQIYQLVWEKADHSSNGTILARSGGEPSLYMYGAAVDPQQDRLYYYVGGFTNPANDGIYRIDNISNTANLLHTNAVQIQALTADAHAIAAYNGIVYYSEETTGEPARKMWRIDYSGGGDTLMYEIADGSIEDIAIAPIAGKVYFTITFINTYEDSRVYQFDIGAAAPVVPATFFNRPPTTMAIYTPPAPEMNLKQGVTNIADGGSYDYSNHLVNSNTDVTFTIENTGTADLNITLNLTLVGDTDQFSITDQPDATVAAGGSTTFTVRFSPTSSGAKTATIAITNNDYDENPYNLTLNGLGTTAPVINNLDADSVTFTEGTPVKIDAGSNAAVTDADGLGYNTGNVTAYINGGGTANEDFGVDGITVTSGGDAVIAAGETISIVGEVDIGTVHATYHGQNGANLVITLDANATDGRLSALLRSITYNNDSQDPSGARTVVFTVRDLYDASDPAEVIVTLEGVNDPPTLTATGQNPTFTEGGAAADLFSAITVSTNETGQTITELKLTVTNVNNGANEIMSVDGSDVALTDGNSVTTATNSMDATVSVAGTTATVTIAKAGGISTANMQTLVDGMTYRNTSDNPNTSNRVVTLTSIKDNGGTAGGGVDTTALAVTSTVTITAVNDRPVVSNVNGDAVDVVAGGSAGLIDENSNASVTDADSADFDGGNLTIAQALGTANGNFSVDGANVTSGGDATIAAGETIAVGGVSIGIVHGVNDGQGGNNLFIALSANATPTQVATLIKNISYAAPSGLGERTFNLTVNDGDGTANGGQDTSIAETFTINVTPNPPVITNLDGDAINYNPFLGGEAILDAGNDATVTDADSPNFNGGNITVTITAGGVAAEDKLGISTTGTITLSAGVTIGSTVSVSGVNIGTITANGTGGNNLVVLFNVNATPTWVTTLLRALTYENTNNVNPSLAARTIQVTITDAGASAATSAPSTVTVNMVSPEMNLQQSGTDIADGGAFDFGDHTTNTDTDVIFTIQNTGTAALTLTTPVIIGGANADQFSIQLQPVSPVAAAGTTTFIIRFTPTSVGLKIATISIVNNDINETPYDVIIQGTGIAVPPPTDDTIRIIGEEANIATDANGRVQYTYIITSSDGALNITIPAGTIALDSAGNPINLITVLLVADPPPPPPGVNIVGPVFSLGPPGTTFVPPLTITFHYEDADIPPGMIEGDLQLAFYNEATGEWIILDCTVNTHNNTITAKVSHFTDFAIISKLPANPAAFTVSNLVIDTAESESRETITISVDVTNTGGSSGVYYLILKINGVEVDTIMGALAAGGMRTIVFTVTGQPPGRYTVEVNGLTGSYEVITSPPATEPATKTPPPAPEITTPPIPDIQPPPVTSTLTPPASTASETEKPLSWWLIAIIVAGGLLIILVALRLVRRVG